MMELPPDMTPQLPGVGGFSAARFGSLPLSPAEETAVSQVFGFLCLRDGYSPERKLAQHALRAREEESPRKPGTFGALVLETDKIIDREFTAVPQFTAILQALSDPAFRLNSALDRHRLPAYLPADSVELLLGLFQINLNANAYGALPEVLPLLQKFTNDLSARLATHLHQAELPAARADDRGRLIDAAILMLLRVHDGLADRKPDRGAPGATAFDLVCGQIERACFLALVDVPEGRGVGRSQITDRLHSMSSRPIVPHRLEHPDLHRGMLEALRGCQLTCGMLRQALDHYPLNEVLSEAASLLQQADLTALRFQTKEIIPVIPEGDVRVVVRHPSAPPLMLSLSGIEQTVRVGVIDPRGGATWPPTHREYQTALLSAGGVSRALYFQRHSSSRTWAFAHPFCTTVAPVTAASAAILAPLAPKLDAIEAALFPLMMRLWTEVPLLFDAAVTLDNPLHFEVFWYEQAKPGDWSVSIIANDSVKAKLGPLIPASWSWHISVDGVADTGSAPASASSQLAIPTKAPNLMTLLGDRGYQMVSILRALNHLGVAHEWAAGSHSKLSLNGKTEILSRTFRDSTERVPFGVIRGILRRLEIDPGTFAAALERFG